MPLTVSKLRENIYNIIDQVIETGEPVQVVRNGTTLNISVEKKKKVKYARLDNLEKRDVFIGDPDEIMNIDWSQYWNVEDR